MTIFSPVNTQLNASATISRPCSVTCTATVYASNGNSFSFTVKKGGIFTSCENAAIKACDSARELAEHYAEYNNNYLSSNY